MKYHRASLVRHLESLISPHFQIQTLKQIFFLVHSCGLLFTYLFKTFPLTWLRLVSLKYLKKQMAWTSSGCNTLGKDIIDRIYFRLILECSLEEQYQFSGIFSLPKNMSRIWNSDKYTLFCDFFGVGVSVRVHVRVRVRVQVNLSYGQHLG